MIISLSNIKFSVWGFRSFIEIKTFKLAKLDFWVLKNSEN